ncbi:hypothetical protein KP509_01G058500 [Ceratopteris richardii]|uniref:Histone H2A n=1 Tax=Ceratopteris richardii TaxID=49495 RepID=A0A8T2VPV5_CERRI|nr:hypothetical protein KP509_01G058500 [Ceratopteris richardii]
MQDRPVMLQQRPARYRFSNKGSRSERAGLYFPVGRVGRRLRCGNYSKRVTVGADVYLSAVLEYLTGELLELAGNAAMENKKHKISNRHIQLAIRFDKELSQLLSHAVIPSAGVAPFIHPFLKKRRSRQPASLRLADSSDGGDPHSGCQKMYPVSTQQ